MSEIDNTPDGWHLARLDDVADIVMGQSPHGESVMDWDGTAYNRAGLPFIQGNSEFGIRHPNPVKWCLRPAKIADIGDLLISVRAPVGETNLADQRIAIGRGLAAIRFKAAEPTFGWHILNFTKGAFRRSAQGSTFDAIGSSQLRSLSFPLPPFAEQQVIATVLDAIDESIDTTEAATACIGQLRDSVLEELLTRGIPGMHSEWRVLPSLGTFPASWSVECLADVLTLNQPGAWGGDPTPDDPGVRVLRAADLTRDGRIDPGQVLCRRLSWIDRERRLMEEGDLILERSGGGPGRPVGRVALVAGLDPIYCSNFCQHLRVDKTRCNPRYIARALWHRYLRNITARLEHRTTGIRNLDYPGYLTFPLPLPSLGEQARIAMILDSIDNLIEQQRKSGDRLRLLRVSVSQSLFSGKTRVPQDVGRE